MGSSGLPRINEVAAYLHAYAPEAQAELRSIGPEFEELTELGTWGGSEAVDTSTLQDGLAVRGKILAAALAEAITQSESDVALIDHKLATLRRFRFASQLLAAIGSSGVLALAFSASVATVVVAVIALAGSVASLAAETLVLGQNGSETLLRNLAATLTKVIGQGSLTRRLLATLDNSNLDIEEMRELISSGNVLFGEILSARGSLKSIR